MNMVLTLKDFASMRLPVAVFVASIILSAVMIKFSSVQNKAAETQRGRFVMLADRVARWTWKGPHDASCSMTLRTTAIRRTAPTSNSGKKSVPSNCP